MMLIALALYLMAAVTIVAVPAVVILSGLGWLGSTSSQTAAWLTMSAAIGSVTSLVVARLLPQDLAAIKFSRAKGPFRWFSGVHRRYLDQLPRWEPKMDAEESPRGSSTPAVTGRTRAV